MKVQKKLKWGVALLCAAALWLPGAAAAKDKSRLVVLDLVAEGGVRSEVARLLNEAVLAAFDEAEIFEVFGPSDIARMLEHEQAKQLVGCEDDSCLAEIGGAMGAQRIAAVSLGRLGDAYLANLKLINVQKARVEGRVARTLGEQESDLLEGMRDAVRELIDKSGMRPRSAPNYGMWISGGLALAAIGTGAAMGGLALSDNSAMEDEVKGSARWQSLKDDSKNKALLADVFIGVGAAAAASAILFGIFGASAPASVAVVPEADGTSVSARWSF